MMSDPEKWRQENNAYTTKQNAINHYIEHWACEYWDENQKQWGLLDANNTFLKAHSDIDITFHLPREHFEYAFEAWKRMRNENNFNPDRYAEDPQDGRSHIRSQMLQDFFSLLNHDVAGWEGPQTNFSKFIKLKSYEDLSTQELKELDKLANLISADPEVDELAAFYQESTMPRIEFTESVPYSFVGN